MASEAPEEAELGWHGLVGDRRLAFRLVDDRGGFPWLTATRLPELLLFSPVGSETAAEGRLPTHVRTPEGKVFGLFSRELESQVGDLCGSQVQMTHLNRGIFDEASVSVIASATVLEVAQLVEHRPDVRRFRPNLQISLQSSEAFEEDTWVGGLLSFGSRADSAAIAITNRDERCSMINIDPDSAVRTPEILKAVVRERSNLAGVYGTVIRCGHLTVGQPVYFTPLGGIEKLL